MEEQKVKTIPLVSDPQPFLARHECEVMAEFEKKAFEVYDERFFELAYGVLILQPESVCQLVCAIPTHLALSACLGLTKARAKQTRLGREETDVVKDCYKSSGGNFLEDFRPALHV